MISPLIITVSFSVPLATLASELGIPDQVELPENECELLGFLGTLLAGVPLAKQTVIESSEHELIPALINVMEKLLKEWKQKQ